MISTKSYPTMASYSHIYPGWWFGTFFMTFHILGIVTPTDELIFFRGVGSTTNLTLQSADDHPFRGLFAPVEYAAVLLPLSCRWIRWDGRRFSPQKRFKMILPKNWKPGQTQYLLLFMFFGTLFLSPIQHHRFFGVETCGLVA